MNQNKATILKPKTNEFAPVVFKYDGFQQTGPGLFDTHYPVEIGIVTKGQLKRTSGAWEITLNPGDLYLCGIWEPHQSTIEKAPYECCILHLDPVYLAKSFSADKNNNLLQPFLLPLEQRAHPASKHAELWLSYAKRLIELHQHSQLNRDLKTQHIAVELLTDLISLIPIDSSIDQKPVTTLPNMAKLFETVFQNKGVLSLEEASKIQKVNKNKFCKVFLNTMGMTFNHFCLNYRLSEVERELRMSEDPIKKIAYEWGFSDTSHLNKYFKKKYQESPQVYRDRFQTL